MLCESDEGEERLDEEDRSERVDLERRQQISLVTEAVMKSTHWSARHQSICCVRVSQICESFVHSQVRERGLSVDRDTGVGPEDIDPMTLDEGESSDRLE